MNINSEPNEWDAVKICMTQMREDACDLITYICTCAVTGQRRYVRTCR